MNGDSDISAVMKTALENPEILAKAAGIAKELSNSGLLSLFGGFGDDAERKDAEKNIDDGKIREKNENNDKESGSTPKKEESFENSLRQSRSTKDRIALLSALKPYVSDDKKGKIDLVIKLCRIMDIAKESGIRL